MTENVSRKRNPSIALQLSLRFAKEYLRKLCEIQNAHTDDEIQESNDLLIVHRALWTALIIEIGKLFDTFNDRYRKVISLKREAFFQNIPWKDKIDSVRGEMIISKMIRTRKTFTAHWGEDNIRPVSVREVCDSKLEKLLDQLDKPLSEFDLWFKTRGIQHEK